jgi:sulfoxide reductase heme-binding subunit YedZ
MAAPRVDRWLRWGVKPLVFGLCLLPLAKVAAGVAGVGGISLGADPVEEILETFGKWTLNFLLITLCITPLRQLTAFGDLIRFRRMLGLFAFTYACLHFATYLVLDRGLEWNAIVVDLAKRPYITIGFTALLLLFPLALTSTRGMMRRLGRRWQKLHRLVYVIAILGVWHYYWQVKLDTREPLIYAAILAVLLGYRFWRSRRASRPAARSHDDGRKHETAAQQRGSRNGFREEQQPQ